MSKLADTTSTAAAPSAPPRFLTPERWVGLIVVASFVFLVGTRARFREFIPS